MHPHGKLPMGIVSKTVDSDTEWVEARVTFMKLEAEHKAATIGLAKKRQALPWRKIDQEYVFDGGPLGQKSLAELFGKADTLFVYHLMYSTGKERACPRCTSLLDQFQSLKLHVQASGLMTFAIIAKGKYESLIPAIESNNWIWDFYYASGNSFPENVGVTKGGGLAGAEGMYDYVKPWTGGTEGPENPPGISISKRDADGQVYHTYSVFGTALLELVQYNLMFDLMPKVRPAGAPEMSFLKHKDAYEYPGGVY